MKFTFDYMHLGNGYVSVVLDVDGTRSGGAFILTEQEWVEFSNIITYGISSYWEHEDTDANISEINFTESTS